MYIQITTPLGVFRSMSEENNEEHEDFVDLLNDVSSGKSLNLRFKNEQGNTLFLPKEVLQNSIFLLVKE